MKASHRRTESLKEPSTPFFTLFPLKRVEKVRSMIIVLLEAPVAMISIQFLSVSAYCITTVLFDVYLTIA
jgi:hypothetical protein